MAWPGAALRLARIARAVPLARWAGNLTGPEPLVAVLHVAYTIVPLRVLAIGADALWPRIFGAEAARHLRMAGAISLMTLAVMTRATLGHTGQPLTAGIGTVGIYVFVTVAVLARAGAGFWPTEADWMHLVAGFGWITSFGGLVLIYGPQLLRLPADKRSGLQACGLA